MSVKVDRLRVTEALTAIQVIVAEMGRSPLPKNRRLGLAAMGRQALAYLTEALRPQVRGPRGRGRPPQVRGVGVWLNPGTVDSKVAAILQGRDPDDHQSLTTCYNELIVFSADILPPRTLSPVQRARLKKMVRRAKPNEVARALQGWVFDLPARTVDRLRRSGTAEIRWF